MTALVARTQEAPLLVYLQASIMHQSDDMVLSELAPRTVAEGKEKPKGKAKGHPKTKQEAWHTALDRIIDNQQSEMYRDEMIKEKQARGEAEKASEGGRDNDTGS